jgi:hypothetical protein
MPIIPATQEAEVGESRTEAGPGKSMKPDLKTKAKRAGGRVVVQVPVAPKEQNNLDLRRS